MFLVTEAAYTYFRSKMDAASKKRRGIHDQGTITKRRRERLVRVGELASYIAIASQIFCLEIAG